jgi:hypothetical protein
MKNTVRGSLKHSGTKGEELARDRLLPGQGARPAGSHITYDGPALWVSI